VFGKVSVAGLADTEVTQMVIIDSIVADRSTDSTHIANEVEVSDMLVVIFMPEGTTLLTAWRHSTVHTVQLLTHPAYRAAEQLLITNSAL
jgi:hypothetical protein